MCAVLWVMEEIYRPPGQSRVDIVQLWLRACELFILSLEISALVVDFSLLKSSLYCIITVMAAYIASTSHPLIGTRWPLTLQVHPPFYRFGF